MMGMSSPVFLFLNLGRLSVSSVSHPCSSSLDVPLLRLNESRLIEVDCCNVAGHRLALHVHLRAKTAHDFLHLVALQLFSGDCADRCGRGGGW